MPLQRSQKSVSRRFIITTTVIAVVLIGLIITHRLAIYDWLRLRNYHPSTAIAQLATADTMTPYARRVFYVNHPALDDKTDFAPHCPNGTEQTVVLGCYQSFQNGIYLLQVTDPQLQGIEEVTAAHETLHAMYDRLSSSEKTKVDAMLEDYYQHDLTDPTIKAVIASYKISEPNDVVNEMHSVFGTEAGNLPPALEAYYTRYFTNRAAIVADYDQYQAAFSSRQMQLSQDDSQLSSLKSEVTNDETDLNAQQKTINSQQDMLNQERASGDTNSYNQSVSAYNGSVEAYNAELKTVQTLITQYNQLVADRNAIALEEQQLVKDITSSPSTASN